MLSISEAWPGCVSRYGVVLVAVVLYSAIYSTEIIQRSPPSGKKVLLKNAVHIVCWSRAKEQVVAQWKQLLTRVLRKACHHLLASVSHTYMVR